MAAAPQREQKPAYNPADYNMQPRARTALLVLFAINISNFYDRHALGALAEPIRREFSLTDTQIGALTTIFTLLYAVVGLPLGRLADAWSRRKLLALGMLVWSALTAASGVAVSYAMLVFTRLGVGVGEAVCAPAATSWIGDLYPPGRRSGPLALFMLGVPIGAAMGFMISGPAAQAFGWRMALLIAAAPVIVLLPALLALREPRRGESENLAQARVSSWSVLKIPTLWWIIASGALINFNLYTLGTFLPAFLTRYHHLSVSKSGFWTGVGHAVAGVLAAASSGYIGDRIFRRRRDGRLLAASVAAGLAAPVAWLAVRQPAGSGLIAALLLICTAYGLLNMYYGLVYAAIQDIVPPALRGTTMAIYFMAMYLCGASFGPLITGRLSDMMARRAALLEGFSVVTEASRAVGLHQAMYVIPVISLALALVLYAGSRTMRAPAGSSGYF